MPREPISLLPIELIDYLSVGTRRAWRTFRYALADRMEEKLPHMRVPTLVVRGSRDTIVPQRWAHEVTGLLPMGRLSVIPGAAPRRQLRLRRAVRALHSGVSRRRESAVVRRKPMNIPGLAGAKDYICPLS